MKVSAFAQVAYRKFSDGFEKQHDSSVTTPWSLVDPVEVRAAYRDYLDGLMLAARSGFDGLVFTEHGQASYDMMANPSLVASALAYATESAGLDVAIYPAGRSLGKSREPLRVAEEYAMIDNFCGGRLVAGFPVGLMYDASINNGVPPIEIRGRFDENLALVLKAWRENDAFTWNGKFSQFECVNIWPRPQQRPRPPVWLTGTGNPATMQVAFDGDFGFNYLSWFGTKLTGPRIFGRFWDMAGKLGKPLNPHQLGILQVACVAATDAEAERKYKSHIEYLFNRGPGAIAGEKLAIPGGIGLQGLHALMRDPSDFGIAHELRTVSFTKLVEVGAVIIGSVATVTERLTELAKTHRIGNLHLMMQFGSMPRELAMENIGLFGKEVVPKLKALWKDEPHHWWPARLGGLPRHAEVRPAIRAAGGA